MTNIFNLINNNSVSKYIDLNVNTKIKSIVKLTSNDLNLNDEEILNNEINKLRLFTNFKKDSSKIDLFIGFKEDYIKEKLNNNPENYYKHYIDKILLGRYSGVTENTEDNYSIVNFFFNNSDKYNFNNYQKQLTKNEIYDLTRRIKNQKYIERYLTYYLSEFNIKGKQYNYVLLLNNKKIYVGYSNDIVFRLTGHYIKSFMSPNFVKDNHPVMKILYLKSGDKRVENNIVKVLKEKYGDIVYGR